MPDAADWVLTTVFTPPAFCPEAINDKDIQKELRLTECFPGSHIVPGAFRPHSPGICPSGFTVACTRFGWIYGDSHYPPPGETAMICCPK
jgi:hypothetical protein